MSRLSPVPARNNGQTEPVPRASAETIFGPWRWVRKGFSTPSTKAALHHCPAGTRGSACPKISPLLPPSGLLLTSPPRRHFLGLLLLKATIEAPASPGRHDQLDSLFPLGRDPRDYLATRGTGGPERAVPCPRSPSSQLGGWIMKARAVWPLLLPHLPSLALGGGAHPGRPGAGILGRSLSDAGEWGCSAGSDLGAA